MPVASGLVRVRPNGPAPVRLLDVGGAGDCGTAGVKKADRDMARLLPPDRNTDAKDIETRTAHFLKIKKAYETLQDPGSRKLYDGCLLARERLVRKN